MNVRKLIKIAQAARGALPVAERAAQTAAEWFKINQAAIYLSNEIALAAQDETLLLPLRSQCNELREELSEIARRSCHHYDELTVIERRAVPSTPQAA